MSKVAVRTEGHAAVGRSTLKMTEQEPKVEKLEKEVKEQEHQCPEGEHWNEEKNACVKDAMVELTATEKLSIGEPCSPELRACVDKLIADGKPESSAWAICKSQLGETVKLRESKIGAVTWSPIEFEKFDSLLKETKDEVQAARIVKQNREINEAFKNIVYTLNEIITEINKTLEVKLPYVDESWKGYIIELAHNLKQTTEYIRALPKDDLGWKEIKSYDDKDLQQKYDDLRKEVSTLKEIVVNQEKNFNNLLDSADKSVKDYFAANKKEMEAKDQKIKELEKKLTEAEAKKLEETESLETRVDNLEGKLKGEFKSKAQKPKEEEKASPNLTYKPGA